MIRILVQNFESGASMALSSRLKWITVLGADG